MRLAVSAPPVSVPNSQWTNGMGVWSLRGDRKERRRTAGRPHLSVKANVWQDV